MTSRERVLAVLRGHKPDRVPLNVFAGWNPEVQKQVEARYGSLDAFYERFHIDAVTGVLPRFPFGREVMTLDHYLTREPHDPRAATILSKPCDEILSMTVAHALQYHQQQKAVICHAWGVFELSQFLFERNGIPGLEQALLNMASAPEKTRRLFMKLGAWSADCVEHAIRAGVDVIELSDD